MALIADDIIFHCSYARKKFSRRFFRKKDLHVFQHGSYLSWYQNPVDKRKAKSKLNIDPEGLTIVVHDREDMTLEYIQAGYIDSTLINKTATSAFLSIMLLEAYNNGPFANVPISRDNKAANANPFPKFMYNGTIAITKENVDDFLAENIPQYPTKLYQ